MTLPSVSHTEHVEHYHQNSDVVVEFLLQNYTIPRCSGEIQFPPLNSLSLRFNIQDVNTWVRETSKYEPAFKRRRKYGIPNWWCQYVLEMDSKDPGYIFEYYFVKRHSWCSLRLFWANNVRLYLRAANFDPRLFAIWPKILETLYSTVLRRE